jgi:hypothetical protein
MDTPLETPRGTHPIITILLFGAAIAALVLCGSHFSRERSLTREAGPSLLAPAAMTAWLNR